MMLKIVKSLNNLQLSIIILLICIAVLAISFDMNLMKAVNINIHDGYVTSTPLMLSGVLWIVLSFLVFFIKSAIVSFRIKRDNVFLLLFNTLTVFLVLYSCYVVLLSFSIELFVDHFKTSTSQEHIENAMYSQLFKYGAWLVPLITLEAYLIYLLIKNRTVLSKK